MNIESHDMTVDGLLRQGWYLIPRFQRPYSWDKDNISEFWDDVVIFNRDNYFIGSMVVYDVEASKFGVVDGQQRLTTITIALSVIRDCFDGIGEDGLADGVQTLIERKNLENKSEFIIYPQTSFPFFQTYIQVRKRQQADVAPSVEERSIRDAYVFFDQKVRDVVGVVDFKSVDGVEKDKVVSELRKIRDAFLTLKVVLVKLTSEEDAYVVFEILNARGKDLEVTDLVKNYILRSIKDENAILDAAKLKWVEMVKRVEEVGRQWSMDQFMHHYWLSRYELLTKKQLYKSFRNKIDALGAASVLEELARDSRYYSMITSPNADDWGRDGRKVYFALNAFILFNIQLHMPCALSLIRAYKSNVIKIKVLARALRAIEKFHFIFTAVTSQRSSGTISKIYATYGSRISASDKSQDVVNAIEEMIVELRAKLPLYDEFEALFSNIRYTNKISKDRNLVSYILRAFNAHEKYAEDFDVKVMSIEHLLPQKDIKKDDDAAYIGSIGNMIYIPQGLNEKLSTRAFSDKVVSLISNGVKLDREISVAKKWGKDEIETRTKNMAQIAYNTIWKL